MKIWADPFFQQFRFSFSYALCKTLMNWSCGSIEVTKTKKRKREKLTKGGIFKAHEFSAQAS